MIDDEIRNLIDGAETTAREILTRCRDDLESIAQALLEFESEGLEGRQKRYQESMRVLRKGLADLGFDSLLEDEHQSGILVAIRAPQAPWYDFDHMHDALDQQGFTIYPGKPGAEATFRLAVLGAIDAGDIEAFLLALGRYLEKLKGSAAS